MTRDWFLVQTKPGALRTAEDNLRRQGVETFVPLRRAAERRFGRSVVALRPVFPGYIFAAVDPELLRWRTINSTYGVSRVVSFEADKPAHVPGALVDQLRARCNEAGCLIDESVVTPGAQVKIVSGPFADLIGTVDKLSDKDRVRVLLEIMGQSVGTLIPRDALSQSLS